MYTFELEHCMLNLQVEKVYICRLAEVLCPQSSNKIGSAKPQSVTFAEGLQINF